MRLFTLAICCAVLVTSFADPDPKKYKSNVKKNKTNNTLTAEEREFLRDVEAKFGIKPDVKDNDNTESKPTILETKTTLKDLKPPFPAVIAIEIVNDTDTNTQGKGKRTIDANLGYGYKTNSGYSYTYFGKPTQNKGKFMIYPYSQEDIPPSNQHAHITDVQITPSRAYELIPEQKEAYHYPKPATEFKTEVVSAPSYSSNGHSQASQGYIPSTLYTTYNGHELSGLSGQFPTVMPNYFVEPSQLLRNPEYQNVGLTDDHLRPHEAKIADQRVVPVLVLRIPSSSLKNPTAELFANLPSNYPLSTYLNNVNLQGLVNQYFKKQGFSFAPQVKHYSSPMLSHAGNYHGHNYATSQVQPSYTQSHNSGVQYSAVQPVMAKYPSSYPHHLTLSHGHKLYHQPLQQQKYEYRYQYVPQQAHTTRQEEPQSYYIQPQQHQQTQEVEAVPETNQHESSAEVSYGQQPHVVPQEHYEVPAQQVHQTEQEHLQSPEANKAAYAYFQQQQQEQIQTSSPSYEHLRGAQVSQQYYTQEAPKDKETKAVFHSQINQESLAPSHVETGLQYPTASHGESGIQYQTPNHAETSIQYQAPSHVEANPGGQYQYQQQSSDDASDLVLTENYPSKDHTIATVLPVSYTAKQPSVVGVQTVSYVTPMPYSSKYQSPYRIMVPQTFLANPSTERVTYVDSHSVSAFTHPSQQEHNLEAEYTLGPQHVPPIGKQTAPSYPRNYHSHPKRMTKPEMKHGHPTHSRKHGDRNEKRKL